MFLEGNRGAPPRMVSGAEAIGLVAGFFIAASFVPQIIRVWRLRDAQQISLAFNLLNLSGTVLWLAYGFVQGLLSLEVWNGVNTVLVGGLLVVKLRYGMGRTGPVKLESSGQHAR